MSANSHKRKYVMLVDEVVWVPWNHRNLAFRPLRKKANSNGGRIRVTLASI